VGRELAIGKAPIVMHLTLKFHSLQFLSDVLVVSWVVASIECPSCCIHLGA